MARLFNDQLPVALVFVMSLGVACGSDGHPPPPVGGGGRSTVPPVIFEFGGTVHAGGSTGAGTGPTNGGVLNSFAGSSAFGPGGGFAGDTSSFGGAATVGSGFAGVSTAGTSQGGSIPTSFGGSDGFSGSVSGSF